MTIMNREAANAYLHALNEMHSTSKPAQLAAKADSLAGAAFDGVDWGGIKKPDGDRMMDIETAMFTALCDANGVDWRLIQPA